MPRPRRLGDGLVHPSRTDPLRLRQRSAESLPVSTHPGAGVMATADAAGRNTARVPICGCQGPHSLDLSKVQCQGPRPDQSCVGPPGSAAPDKGRKGEGSMRFQPLRWRTGVGMALRPAGDRKPGGTGPSACCPPHGIITRSPTTCPTPSGASWCLGHTGGCGLCSRIPTDIAG